MIHFIRFATLACLLQLFQCSFACNGYDIRVLEINNSKGVVIEVYDVELSEDCQLLLNACIKFNKSFEKSKISYTAKKYFLTPVDVRNDDLCRLLDEFKFPVKCPIVAAESYCNTYENPINIEKYKHLLMFASGEIDLAATITLGDKTTTERLSAVIELYRK